MQGYYVSFLTDLILVGGWMIKYRAKEVQDNLKEERCNPSIID